MADPRQCVVLAKDRDEGAPDSHLGDERGLHTAGAALDGHLLRLQVVRERRRREALLEGELGPRVDLQREPVERRRARIDALGDPLLTRRGVQVVLRLPRTRRGTRGQNELGQDDSGNDESPRDDAQSVHGAKKTEGGEKGPDLDAAADGRRALRPAAPRACERRVPFLDGHADQRDGARDGNGGAAHDGGDREGLGRIAGQQHEHHGGDRRQSAQREERPRQLSSTLERGSIRRGRATCSPPAAIGACASVSIALEARESARSVSSNFFVAFSRWRPSWSWSSTNRSNSRRTAATPCCSSRVRSCIARPRTPSETTWRYARSVFGEAGMTLRSAQYARRSGSPSSSRSTRS